MKIAISILSGGLDSCVSTACAIKDGYEVIALHFNYFQRTMQRELESFNNICDFYNIEKIIINMDFFKDLGGTSLVDTNIPIPKNKLGDNGLIPNTYVPFRNGVFYSIAASIADRYNASSIYTGLVYEDASNYPDTRPDFVKSTECFIKQGTQKDISLITPLLHLSKAEIIKLGYEIGAPIGLSYSCYENNDLACGKCESCQLRLRAFKQLGLKDEIEYLN